MGLDPTVHFQEGIRRCHRRSFETLRERSGFTLSLSRLRRCSSSSSRKIAVRHHRLPIARKVEKQIIAKMVANVAGSGIAVGLHKGHAVTKREMAKRPSANKGKLGKRTSLVRKLIREVVGFAPYEKRITELLKVGKDKRALKVAKKKLGTHLRAKRKREEMTTVLRKMRATGGADKKK